LVIIFSYATAKVAYIPLSLPYKKMEPRYHSEVP